MLILLLAAQSAVSPDIQLRATVDARSVKVEQRGETRLEVHADPDAGSLVKVEAPRADDARVLRNLWVALDAEARIAALSGMEANADAPPTDATDAGELR